VGFAPLIGVTGHPTETAAGRKVVAANDAYLDAIRLAGGVPVILPPVMGRDEIIETLAHLDGVLFTGGKDVDPMRYGEALLNTKVAPEPERDAFELPLAAEAVERNFPVLAICRGMQVLNVALGGTLWQDIPDQLSDTLPHFQKAPREETTHRVDVRRDSLLADLVSRKNGDSVGANSFHHQAARVIASRLVPVAHAPDGIVEAVEAPERDFVLGIQWHPEHLAATRAEHRELFEGLVRAAQRYRSSRDSDSR
jgi:putative glutamine amidotransferase